MCFKATQNSLNIQNLYFSTSYFSNLNTSTAPLFPSSLEMPGRERKIKGSKKALDPFKNREKKKKLLKKFKKRKKLPNIHNTSHRGQQEMHLPFSIISRI